MAEIVLLYSGLYSINSIKIKRQVTKNSKIGTK